MAGKGIVSVAAVAAVGAAFGAENLALGKPYRFLKPANYRLCADPEDMKQLTDGVYAPTDGQLWVKKECVGWSIGKGEGLVTVTVDLGETKALVKDGVECVLSGCRDKNWSAANDHAAMDNLRLRVLRALEKREK